MNGLMEIVLYSLRAILRTRFFWAWNGSLVLLCLGLNHITFFDFEENSLVPELFSATLLLSGAANFIVYQLSGIREISLGQWDLLILRPVTVAILVAGRLLAAMLFQGAVALSLAAAYLLDSAWLGRQIQPGFWASWYVELLQVSTLGAFYFLLSTRLNELWGLFSMIGSYLLAQSSQIIPYYISGNMSSLIFCVLPDLAMFAGRAGDDVPGMRVPFLLWRTAYCICYLALMGYLSSLVLSRRLEKP